MRIKSIWISLLILVFSIVIGYTWIHSYIEDETFEQGDALDTIDAIVSSDASPLEVSNIDVSKWMTYRNLKHGYEFSLPSEYKNVSEYSTIREKQFDPYSDSYDFLSNKDTSKHISIAFSDKPIRKLIENILDESVQGTKIVKQYTNGPIDIYEKISGSRLGCENTFLANLIDASLVIGMCDDFYNENLHVLDSFRINQDLKENQDQ